MLQAGDDGKLKEQNGKAKPAGGVSAYRDGMVTHTFTGSGYYHRPLSCYMVTVQPRNPLSEYCTGPLPSYGFHVFAPKVVSLYVHG